MTSQIELIALEHITVLRVKILEIEEFAHYGLTDDSLLTKPDSVDRREKQ